MFHIIQIQHGTSKEFWPRHGFWVPVCVHCNLDLEDMTFVHGHDTPLGQGKQLAKISRSNKELWPGHIFLVYVHCDLDLRDMTLTQGHDTPLGHGQHAQV